MKAYMGKAAEDYLRIQEKFARARFHRLAVLTRRLRLNRLHKKYVNQTWRKRRVQG